MHLQHPSVASSRGTIHPSTVPQEKRQEGEAWFRTLGLLKLGPGRRDDALWRKAGPGWPGGWVEQPMKMSGLGVTPMTWGTSKWEYQVTPMT